MEIFLASPTGDVSIWAAALLFLGIAFMYSSVGLGGGSSYTALLTIFGVSYIVIPTVSLSLNLIVTLAGSINFIRRKHARFGLIWPFLVTSIPAAYLGGSLHLSQTIFGWLLFISLIFVAARIYLVEDLKLGFELSDLTKSVLPFGLGGLLGFLAGAVGIGGGIYLVPLIILFGLGKEKEAAATGAIFIWINSLFGIIARVQVHEITYSDYLPLIGAVAIGGFFGSYLGASRISPKVIQRILGIVILVALVLLVRKLLLA
ncbi:MAG: sulfite exporter TauE/SafE family protein [Rhodothermia bacterium]|nr:MAG: sulfite exporter TauE/SafE family protein [Rhodothermia bacterium]